MRYRRVHCIGGCVIDRSGETREPRARLRTSNIGTMSRGRGGAARNVAETLARLAIPVSLSTAVGDDEDGREIVAVTEAAGVDVSRCRVVADARTATYTAIFGGDGDLVVGLADMAIFERLDAEAVAAELGSMSGDDILFLDANLPEATIAALVEGSPGPVAAGAVSVQKSVRLARHAASLDMLFLNRSEAPALLGAHPGSAPEPPREAEALAAALAALPVAHGVVTDGERGAVVWTGGRTERLACFPARAVNVNGAGDALAAGTLARLAHGDEFSAAARFGAAVAAMTVEHHASVRADLTMDAVLARLSPEDRR